MIQTLMQAKNLSLSGAGIGAAAVAWVLLGPEGGLIVAGVLGAGAAVKAHGKRNESRGGRPHHKATAPLAALSTAFGIGHVVPEGDAARICDLLKDLLERVCADPDLALTVPGLVAVGIHQAVNSVASAFIRGRATKQSEASNESRSVEG